MFPSSYHHEIFRSYYHGQKWCPCKTSRSKVKVTEVKRNFDPNWAFPDSNSSLNSLMAMKWCTKLQLEFTDGYEMMHKVWSSIGEVPYCFSRSSVNFKVTGAKKSTILTRIELFWTLTQGHRSNCKVTRAKNSTILIKGLRMVTRALWRSEARRVVPWSETLHEP